MGKKNEMELVKLMEWNFFAAEEPPAHNQQQKQLNFSSILFTSFNQLLWLKWRKSCVVCWFAEEKKKFAELIDGIKIYYNSTV